LIKQGTSRGLLLTPVAPGAGTMADKLWDPAAAQASRTFDEVIAASATQVAWVPSCVARCRMQVLNLATGREASVELPAASSVASAAFSPDGSFLVVQVSFSDNTANGARAVQLERVSLANGRLTAVPQTWVSSDALVGFGWPAGSDSLIAEFSFTTKVQLASWRPGASRLAIVVLRPQHSPASLVIGQYSP
jgi:dipeptidyl aminopeptidase/acylaminoacyl peptidase